MSALKGWVVLHCHLQGRRTIMRYHNIQMGDPVWLEEKAIGKYSKVFLSYSTGIFREGGQVFEIDLQNQPERHNAFT